MKKLSLMIAALTLFGVGGCSPAEHAAAPEAPENTAAPAAPEAEEPAAEEPTAEEPTAEEPALSGKVTVYMPSPTGLADNIAAAFTAATGIEVEQFQGTTGEILARLETEEANPIADVVILASWSDGLSMKNEGKLMSYTPAHADVIADGWIDEDSMLFGYSASAAGVIYNTTLIPELSADWSELASEEYAGQLAIPDPEKSGSCKDFLSGYVLNNGWEDFENMAANGLVVPGANSAALSAVVTGEVSVLVAGVDYNAYSSIAKGEPLAVYYPAGGTVVNPRPAMIPNTAPNVDNAKAFVDFLFSDEVQKMVTDVYLLPGRTDITYDNRATLDEIAQINYDWDGMMGIASETAAKLNELCQ